MTTKAVRPNVAGRWLKPREVAELLGVPPSRVRDWIRDGTLPVIKDDGRYYVRRQWVEEFATQREQLALAQQRQLRQRRSFNRRAG